MLGRLLHTAASSLNSSGLGNTSPSRPSTALESTTEETHTYNLVFPDANLLKHSHNHTYPLSTSPFANPTSTSRFDDHGEIDLDASRDIRILIAQDYTASLGKTVLFDSRPVNPKIASSIPSAPSPIAGGTESSARTRHRSLSKPIEGASRGQNVTPDTIQQESRLFQSSQSSVLPGNGESEPSGSIFNGAFHRAQVRGTSLSASASQSETGPSRYAREGDDEKKTLLDCVFGSTMLSYKGPTTKLHVLPAESKASNSSPEVVVAAGDGRKRSQLARSFTPSNPQPELATPNPSSSTAATKGSEKRSILITRMFSVTLPEKGESSASYIQSNAPQNSMHSAQSYPFPRMGGGGSAKPSKVKQWKSPMYAVAIVIDVPASSQAPSVPQSQSGPRPTNSLQGTGSFPSSLDSERRSGWTLLDSPFGFDSVSSAATASDCDDRVDMVTKHWDVITRTLSVLQATAQEKIFELLKQAEVTSPLPPANHLASPVRNERQGPPTRDKQMQRTNQRTVQLLAGALSLDEKLKAEVERAQQRIVQGIKIPHVVTGQGRWSVWREEARWVSRWAGGKEQNFFFFNLLTAFLGNHTEWLNTLGPSWHRRRHHQQVKASSNDELAISSRTVIISSDKIAARRLLFLLSAFLPSAQRSYDNASLRRPGSSASPRPYSRSPPTNISVTREASLRRTINKKTNATRPGRTGGVHSRAVSMSTSGAHPPLVNQKQLTGSENVQDSLLDSEARSLKTANLPIPSGNGTTKKSSATTTSTATPNTTVPVPHFSTQRVEPPTGTTAEARPGSSGSLASLNLMHTLKRNNSTNISNTSTDSQSASKWGSLISGFWSHRRESSTDESDVTPSPDDGLGISGLQKSSTLPTELSQIKLARMAAEVGRSVDDGELYQEDLEEQETPSSRITTAQASPELHYSFSVGAAVTPEGQSISGRQMPTPAPLKMSIDEKDGVIDVELPTGSGFLTSSFGSGISSPPFLSGFTSDTSLEGMASSFYHASAHFSHLEAESPVTVAGWLKCFHEDFAVQSIRPYADLEKEIKRSMRAEPTPNLTTTPNVDNGPTERWVDVCSTLIADVQTFSIRRLRLRRRLRFVPSNLGMTPIVPINPEVPTHSRYGNPYTHGKFSPDIDIDHNPEEKFIEEPIMDMDGILVDAVERVLAQSGHSSRVHSAASSRSSSRRGRPDHHADSKHTFHQVPEVPRAECKKMVLGALAQVVKSVTAARTREEHDGHGKDVSGDENRGKKNHVAESTLREGVRKWLDDIEVAS
ncbi:MAG: hypothetical protein M1827_002213 [Pycnora praestabilis]|nr:MAG: hypothetical protein M1827_002213 [Pycnora praestabilis]